MDAEDAAKLPAVENLQMELTKTGVISDMFKDFLMSVTMAAVEQAHALGASGGVDPELHEEFLTRAFADKAVVKLKAKNISEFLKQIPIEYAGRLLGEYIDRYFPNTKDETRGVDKLFLGTHVDISAVREWLWRELNEHPEKLVELERELVK